MIATKTPTRLPALDGLRGFAIFLVLIYHYSGPFKPDDNSVGYYLLKCVGLSWSGVDLFFVLSGFLIGGILIDNRGAYNLLRVFYIRRTLRIFPLYYLLLAAFVVILVVGPNVQWLLTDPLPVWSYASFTQNFVMGIENTFGAHFFDVTWSLAVEEQFYLILPFVIRYTTTRNLPWVLLSLIVASPVIRIAIFHWFSQRHFLSLYVLMPCRADALLLGVLCAVIYRSDAAMNVLRKNIVYFRIVVSLLALATALLAINGSSPNSRIMVFGGYTLIALLYSSMLLAALIESGGPIAWITKLPFLRKLGTIAFGAYLTHQIVLGFAHGLLLNQAPSLNTIVDLSVTMLALSSTILLSALSFNGFEKHLIALGHRVEYADSAGRWFDALRPSRHSITRVPHQ
jgi:peptidoglycan/LPS O-acetylase OafA/YrhL